ncbi:MAG: 2OG-Fe(II) oxygenase family protein, partial [Pseudomonadota bacterium]
PEPERPVNMTTMARRFNRLIALALSLPEDHFDAHFESPTTWLRLLFYPQQVLDSTNDQYGSAPHTDHGFLTFLAQDSIGGLEVRTFDGNWISAPPIPSTFVVNVADMLSRWTNNRWPSTPHRVRNTSGAARYSIPFFWDTHLDCIVEPLPAFCNSDNPAQFAPVRYGDYVLEKLGTNYSYRQSD